MKKIIIIIIICFSISSFKQINPEKNNKSINLDSIPTSTQSKGKDLTTEMLGNLGKKERAANEVPSKGKDLVTDPNSEFLQNSTSLTQTGATNTPGLSELLKYDPDAKNYLPGQPISEYQIQVAKESYYFNILEDIGIIIGCIALVGLFLFFLYKLLK